MGLHHDESHSVAGGFFFFFFRRSPSPSVPLTARAATVHYPDTPGVPDLPCGSSQPATYSAGVCWPAVGMSGPVLRRPGEPAHPRSGQNGVVTEMLYLKDAYLRDFDATITVVDAGGRRVGLDRTAFYATGGGQPHDTGALAGNPVIDVRKEDEHVWHTLGGDGPLPRLGATVHGEIDWDRRHALMRTHTALHVLCGVIWNEWGKAVTGGNMEPLSARMDFEFDPLPEGFGAKVEELVNAELRAARPD